MKAEFTNGRFGRIRAKFTRDRFMYGTAEAFRRRLEREVSLHAIRQHYEKEFGTVLKWRKRSAA